MPVTVNYATANGTATAGSDYTAASGTLTFARRPDQQDDHRHGQRRHGRRAERDVLRQPQRPDQRHHRRRPGPRHDPQRRYRASAISDVTVTEGNSGHERRHLHGEPLGGGDLPGDGQVRHGRRHGHRRQRLHRRQRHPDLRPPARRARRSASRSTATRPSSRTRRSTSTSAPRPTPSSPTPRASARSSTTTRPCGSAT